MTTTSPASAVPYTHTLPCGMRVICAPSATDVVYCGIAVDAGTRDELPDENGLAHFCEHLTFKGTHRRRSWHILNRMESVGGDLNAYTGKEETIYYTAFLKEHFARAVDLLADIVLGSTYPQTEMNKEVEVVIDEIESYNDSPSELIFDDFENLIFCGHPLGRNILGEAGRLRGFRSEDIQRFARRLYRPDRMVFFVYGRIEPTHACREITKALKRVASSLPEGHPFQTLLQTDASPARPDRNDAARTAVPEYRPQTVTLHKRHPSGTRHDRRTGLQCPRPAPPEPLPAEQYPGRPGHELTPQPESAREARTRIYGGKRHDHLHRHRLVERIFRLRPSRRDPLPSARAERTAAAGRSPVGSPCVGSRQTANQRPDRHLLRQL